VYVEVVPGGFHGLWKDGADPSVYELGRDGEVVREDLKTFDARYLLSDRTARWERVAFATPVAVSLRGEDRAKIVELVMTLERGIGCVSIEWVANDRDGVVFFDLSQESRQTDDAIAAGRVVSAGFASGPARIIDARVFDDLFDNFHDVHVVATKKYQATVSSNSVQQRLTALVGEEPPIVVTEYPNRTLAPLIPHVAGFVFRRAAMLCHLSILLREHGVPAVVQSHDEAVFKEGQVITIADGRVIVNS
jgi:phosphohistidine swiveling domain-containing protein